MVWPYIALALGSIVGYDLLKSWMESQAQEEVSVSPAIIIALILLAIYLLRR